MCISNNIMDKLRKGTSFVTAHTSSMTPGTGTSLEIGIDAKFLHVTGHVTALARIGFPEAFYDDCLATRKLPEASGRPTVHKLGKNYVRLTVPQKILHRLICLF